MVISLCSFDCSCILMCDVRDVRECYSIVRVYSCVMLCDVWECYSVVRVYSCVMCVMCGNVIVLFVYTHV